VTLRAVVLGATGQLGRAVLAATPAGTAVVPYDRATADVADAEAIARVLREAEATVVLNCAAYTGVDDAERDFSVAELVNADGPEHVGRAAKAVGARVVHVSTDYVFSGRTGVPYAPADATDPLGVYGRTKRDGERRLLASCPDTVVVRTAWVHAGHGRNFVCTAVRLLRERGVMEVVDDQIGTPTRAAHLARALWLAAAQPALRGLLHFTDAGVASWYDVADCVRETLVAAGAIADSARVVPVPTSRVPRPAPRPHCGVLDKHASWAHLGWIPPHWRVGVAASTRELL
jgi:dTDP-4-dehydrorhamnose reductase